MTTENNRRASDLRTDPKIELPPRFQSGRLVSALGALAGAGLPIVAHKLLPGTALVDWAGLIGMAVGGGLAWAGWGGISRIAAGLERHAENGGATPVPPGRFDGRESGVISTSMLRLIQRVQQQAGDASRKARADAYIGKTLALLDALDDPVFWIGHIKGELIVTYANTAARRLGIKVVDAKQPLSYARPPEWLGDPLHSGRVEAVFGSGRDAEYFEFVKREVSESRRKDDPAKWDGAPVNGGPGRVRVEEAVVAVLGRDITERKVAEERERIRAMTDPLTGIFNRAGYNKEIKKAEESGIGFAIIYIDLDKFKPVNDTYGHPAGDALLIEVAKVLKGMGGIPFRLGGDEFAMILPGADKARTEAVAANIVEACNRPFDLKSEEDGSVTVQIGASVGCACLPLHASNSKELLDAADAAMYVCKKRGRNQYAFPD